MKRIIALMLVLSLLLSGCAGAGSSGSGTESGAAGQEAAGQEAVSSKTNSGTEAGTEDSGVTSSTADSGTEAETASPTTDMGTGSETANDSDVTFSGLDDPNLLTYAENAIYSDLISDLDSEDYLVENVQAIYLSEEYIEELAYNSKSNIFFGYTLDEINSEFEGTRYVFTPGEDGQTTVVPLEEVYDDTYDQIIKNVTIGSGVILVCVTVSVITGGLGTVGAAPAISVIFAASATTGTTFALKSGAISFATAAIARGYQTQDFDQAMKAGALAASDGFKWGAISGILSGGIKETLALKGATLNGLTMSEAATIQKESKWPLEAIKSLHSMEEYELYKNANLVPTQLSDGSWALLREIDWSFVDDKGRTNAERVAMGLSPVDPTGTPYELHHIGMKADSPLAILTKAEHHAKETYKALHWAEEGKDITDEAWEIQKDAFWKALLNNR